MTFSRDFIIFGKLISGLVLDYIRWTQLVPMIIGWSFALIMVAGLTLITFQGEIDSLLTRAEPYVEQYFGPAPSEPEANETVSNESGIVEFSGDDIIPWILKIWGVLALLGWVIGYFRNKLFGARPAKKLKKKIGIACIAAVLFALAVLILYLMIGGSSGSNNFEIILPFILLPALLMIVSIWGLTVSHVINILLDAIDRIGSDDRPENFIKSTV